MVKRTLKKQSSQLVKSWQFYRPKQYSIPNLKIHVKQFNNIKS